MGVYRGAALAGVTFEPLPGRLLPDHLPVFERAVWAAERQGQLEGHLGMAQVDRKKNVPEKKGRGKGGCEARFPSAHFRHYPGRIFCDEGLSRQVLKNIVTEPAERQTYKYEPLLVKQEQNGCLWQEPHH